MDIASFVFSMLGIVATVGLTFFVLYESRKAEKANNLILAVTLNAVMELIDSDEKAVRVFEPLKNAGYFTLINHANGRRYYQVSSKDRRVLAGSMGIGNVREIPPTPVEVKWD
jgi:hypothetical protein